VTKARKTGLAFGEAITGNVTEGGGVLFAEGLDGHFQYKE